ncbi:MAG: 50S ribosomal protein L15 [Micavibrio aeruginosavorus]|uniref:Large ribosomal subunit protein uL15 n=1 Tax=Micavibrio aeruginosavorus TaxID=349221 RepID=A0A2W5BJ78_9BACT|nr:MAG: 50S ribosomal protein L15 [Micavibrio aeruginosavorus]
MKLNELKPNEGAKHNYKRVGRGIGSGKGKTAGVGVKGQKARSGVAIKGFEGGQMPLYMRLPKHGFKNIFGKEYATVTLARLQQAVDKGLIDAKATIDADTLLKAKVISHKRDGVRVIGGGSLKTKLALKVSGATAAASEAVSKAGGSVEILKIEVAPVVRKKAK